MIVASSFGLVTYARRSAPKTIKEIAKNREMRIPQSAGEKADGMKGWVGKDKDELF